MPAARAAAEIVVAPANCDKGICGIMASFTSTIAIATVISTFPVKDMHDIRKRF
ncbi:unnamed protein product [Haemonchus placei]|uniref:Uncharacterized protein n=1 Tax=Haemonchus placei TaxID=6290 RepID=A0A3P7XWH8_HAEPC|nr:unnamed protein product [Haemonchus placei]